MTGRLQTLSMGLALLALVAAGAVTGRGVFAQNTPATPSATTDSGTTTDDSTDKDDQKPDRAGHGDGMHRGGGKMGGVHVDAVALAAFLGITSDELKTELRSGSSLAAVAVAHGKTRDELKTFLIEQYTSRLDAIIDASADSKDDSTTTPSIDATPAASTGLLN